MVEEESNIVYVIKLDNGEEIRVDAALTEELQLRSLPQKSRNNLRRLQLRKLQLRSLFLKNKLLPKSILRGRAARPFLP